MASNDGFRTSTPSATGRTRIVWRGAGRLGRLIRAASWPGASCGGSSIGGGNVSSIEKTQHGTYRVCYRTPDGRSRSKSFKRRADADAFAATVETSKLQGTYTDPSLGKTRSGEWAKHVQESRVNLAATTRARDDSYFRSLILPYFADEQLARVNPLQVQKWVSTLLAKDYAPGTIRKAYQLLSAVFESAVNSDLIPRSPCRGIKLPKDVKEEMRFLSAEEVEQLADAIDPRYRALVLTGAYAGLRPGELFGLKVQALDMLRRQLKVVANLTEVSGKIRLGPPKSKAS